MLYELSGKVKKVLDEVTFASGFKKRGLIVVEGDGNSKYPNVVEIDFTKDKTTLIDKVSPGQDVKVKFALSGREWEDPKSKSVRYFTSLTGISIQVAGNASSVPAPAAPAETIYDATDVEMPF